MSYVPPHQQPISNRQREVLEWIADGFPEGVYSGFAHRSVATSLAKRGLIEVVGQRSTWSARVTEAGRRVLEQPLPIVEAVDDEPADEQSQRQTKRLRPVAQMMVDLEAAGADGIEVDHADSSRYRLLAASAERYGHVSEGMTITISWLKAGRHRVVLEPLPTWQTAALAPVQAPKRLREVSDVVTALDASDEFVVKEPGRRRALLILEGLVRSGRARDMRVRFAHHYRIDSSRGNDRMVTGAVFALGEDEFCLLFSQGELTVPYTPSERDLNKAKRGISFPDTEQVPDPRLRLELQGPGRTFWASSWSDSETHPIEADLVHVLNEMELRHDSLVEERAEEKRRKAARAVVREKEQQDAVAAFEIAYRETAMTEQAAAWQRADNLRRYAQAVTEHANTLGEDEQGPVLAWARDIQSRANDIDPLLTGELPPTVPGPSFSDLNPFLPRGHWS